MCGKLFILCFLFNSSENKCRLDPSLGLISDDEDEKIDFLDLFEQFCFVGDVKVDVGTLEKKTYKAM